MPSNSVLRIGSVQAPIKLFPTSGKSSREEPEFVVAGPSGGVLRVEDGSGPRAGGDPLGDSRPPVPEPVGPSRVPWLVEDGTGRRIGDPSEVRTGVRLGDGGFVDCTDRLARIDEETILEAMDVIGFMAVRSVPRERIIGSYWLAPGEPSAAKFIRLIGDTIGAQRRAAVVRWTKRTRQSLGVVVKHASGALMVWEMEFRDRVREPPRAALLPASVRVSPGEMDAASRLVRSMVVGADVLDEVEDERETMRRELYREALEGKVAAVPEPEPEPFSDLMEAFGRAVSVPDAA